MTDQPSLINMGVIGCGYWGPNVIRNFAGLDEVELKYICDIDQARLDRLRKTYPQAKRITDYHEILDDKGIDAVAIVVPVQLHYAIAKESLSAGKHTFVEKPLASNSADANELIGLARRQQRILMVGHTFLYNSAVRYLKQYIEAGECGRIFYIYSNRVNLGRLHRDINAFWSIAPHDISIFIHLLEADPIAVSAFGSSHLHRGIADVVFAVLRFPDNVTAHIHASWLDPVKERRMTIVGSKKMIVYDDIDNETRVKIYDKGAEMQELQRTYGEYQYRLRTGDIFIPKIDFQEPLAVECQHFIHCIRTGTTPLTDGRAGLRVVRVCEAVDRSLESGGLPVSLE
jgi:predicted dehydrogenase